MLQKIKKLLSDKKQMMELVRYVIAGGLTSLLSLAISYGFMMLLAADHTVNGANSEQMLISNAISWVVAVVFAFWINRRMVFRVQDTTRENKWREFIDFIAARAASGVLLELGVAALLKYIGITNTFNRLIILVLVTVFNYVASKFWVFKKRPAKAEIPENGQNEA